MKAGKCSHLAERPLHRDGSRDVAVCYCNEFIDEPAEVLEKTLVGGADTLVFQFPDSAAFLRGGSPRLVAALVPAARYERLLLLETLIGEAHAAVEAN